jgi:ApaG protein
MSASVQAPAIRTAPSRRLGSETVTHGVRVTASPRYLPDQSDPARPHHGFSYAIRIANEGDVPVTLLSRRWRIIDANGAAEEVVGEGVVGRQPRIAPGGSFEYSSSTSIRTRWGTMEGEYTFRRDDGQRLDVRIARFYLASE